MIKVRSEVNVIEVDGKDTDYGEMVIGVESHWNHNERVVLVIDGKKYCVNGKDLIAAIDNARNTVRF